MCPTVHIYFSLCRCGFVLQSLVQDILCGIHIPVVMRSTRRAIPFVNTQILRQRVLIAAKTAGLARRVEGIHFQQFAAVQFRLVRKLEEKLTPTYIGNRLCKSVIPKHSFDIQVFHGYRLVFTGKPCRQLVQEVPADVCDAFMDAGNTDTSVLSIP